MIVQFRRSFQRNDKLNCINSTRFIAHLINQNVAHEILALEILILLLENATNDSVEVAIAFLKECGAKLEDVSRKGAAAIFERLRTILHDGDLCKRVQYMIEVMYAIRKDKFKDHPSIMPELDLIEEDEQFTHMMTLEDDYETEDRLNVFKFDPDFQLNETKYEEIRQSILDAGDGDSGSNDDDDESGSDDDDDDEETTTATSTTIIDNTETNLINLRKTIYLTIQSSLDFEECAHKLLKLDIKPPQYSELCNMIVDCCAQQRTYIKFFGLLAQRFCQINNEFVEPFVEIFKNCYDTIHRFETCKLRNVGKIFAHLLYTDSIPWTVLNHIKLNENDTSSSSRVFIKILFQQLAESMGLVRLNQRIKDPTLDEAFEGLFPRDNPQYTRFAINFFTSIGLGGLTDDLREHLKTMATQKLPLLQENLMKLKQESGDSSGSSSSSSSSDDSSSSDSSSSDDSSSSSEEDESSSTSSDSDEESSDEDSDNHRSSKHKRKNQSKHNKRSSKHHHRNNDDDDERENHRKDDQQRRRRRTVEKQNSDKSSHRRSDSKSERHKKHRKDTRVDKHHLKEQNRNDNDDKDRGRHDHHHQQPQRSKERKHHNDDKREKNLKREHYRDELSPVNDDGGDDDDYKKRSKIRKIRSEINYSSSSNRNHHDRK